MTVQLDHVVHYVNDLNQVIETFAANDLIAFYGGQHKEWGTHNVLSYFDLSYIEFLSIEEPTLAQNADQVHVVVKDALRHLPTEETLSRLALRTDDIEALAACLRQTVQISPIFAGKRTVAKGNLIEWQMFSILGDYQGLPYPFIIQWSGTEKERRIQLQQSGVIQSHPAGAKELKKAIFAVDEPAAVVKHWQELFNLPLLQSTQNLGLLIGDKELHFIKGVTNQLQSIVLTGATTLVGSNIQIGQSTYLFE